LNGKRYRKSLKLRDWARAGRKLAALEDPERAPFKPIAEAVQAFHDATQDVSRATTEKYKRVLGFFARHLKGRSLQTLDEISTDDLNSYRASRPIGPLTWSKELQVLRQFFGFCHNRENPWITRNPAKLVQTPRGLKPPDREPYEPNEIAKILAACDTMGRGPYERLRARAMILTLRHTALRISDVAALARDRVRNGQILLRTLKTGAPIFLPIPTELQVALDTLPVPRGASSDPKYYFWNGVTSRRALRGMVERTLAAVFKRSGVPNAYAHRFRHTLATDLLARGGTEQDVADVLGISPAIVRKHYAKWSQARQERITALMRGFQAGTSVAHGEKPAVIQ